MWKRTDRDLIFYTRTAVVVLVILTALLVFGVARAHCFDSGLVWNTTTNGYETSTGVPLQAQPVCDLEQLVRDAEWLYVRAQVPDMTGITTLEYRSYADQLRMAADEAEATESRLAEIRARLDDCRCVVLEECE